MAHTTMDKQNEILELLQVISRGNTLLRHEVACLRSETAALAKNQRITNAQRSWPEPEGLAHFTLFPQLPVELRARIWMFVCFQEPRVIKLHTSFVTEGDPNIFTFYCVGNYHPPVLHTTRESRWEALKYYKARPVEFRKYDPGYRLVTKTYFNFDIDIIYPVVDSQWKKSFSGDARMNLVEIITKHRTTRNFRRIAIADESDTDDFDHQWSGNANFLLKRRSKIEEILVIRLGTYDVDEVEKQLTPLSLETMVFQWHWDSETRFEVTVAEKLEEITGYLEGAVEDEADDGSIEEDPPSDDEQTAKPINVTNSNFQIAQWRKPLPKVSYMDMLDCHHVRQPRILLA